MKRLASAVFAVTVVLITQPLRAQVQGKWVSTGTMQSDRQNHALVPLKGGNALAAGGVDSNNNVLATAEVYSYSAGAWTLTHSMIAARQLFRAVVLANGKVLVSGGLGVGNTVLPGAELFDPASGQWTSAGSLHVARFGHSATLLSNGNVLVSGGCTTFSNCTPLPAAVSEVYNPTTNSWTKTGSLNTARSYHSAVRLNTGKVLVIGGSTGNTTTSCELYDPSKGTWSNAARTNAARYLHTSTLLPDGKVLVTGGASGKYPINSAELYDPTANTWTLTGNMTTGRYAHTATLLSDNTVLVAGGIGQPISCGRACVGFIPTAKVDIYNEPAGKFTAAALLPRALAYHSTTLLGIGRALTAGGSSPTSYCCVVVNNAEVYTPLTFTFSAASLNFGLLEIGLTSASQKVIVTNVSSQARIISSITSKGDYSQSNNCPATPTPLNPGLSCIITVTFKPTAAGTRQGTVTLNDNDPGSPSQTIALTGVGETLALGFTPASLNLGTVPVSLTSSQSATVTNDSAAPVKLSALSIFPANGTFTQTNNCPTPPTPLNPGQTCTVTITFTPPDVFTYNATLLITNNGNGTAQLPLTGTGADGP